MHEYSIGSRERITIPFYLAFVSIAISYLTSTLLNSASWLHVPSAFTMYLLLLTFFDKYAWKLPLLRKLGIVKTPNLNGSWELVTRSSKNEFMKEYKGNLTIHQTWTGICLNFDGLIAKSTSTMCSFHIKNPVQFSLEWEYQSQRKPEYRNDEYMHYGITRLEVVEPGDKKETLLRGDYFTDKKNQNFYGSAEIRIRK